MVVFNIRPEAITGSLFYVGNGSMRLATDTRMWSGIFLEYVYHRTLVEVRGNFPRVSSCLLPWFLEVVLSLDSAAILCALGGP